MARRDAQLVISAKDKASKVIDEITKAVNALVGSQDEVVESAGKTDTALGKLGSAFSKLDKAIDSLSLGGKIEADLKKSEAAIQRMTDSLASSEGRLRNMRDESDKAGASLTQLAQKAAGAEGALKSQTAAVDKAAKEHGKLSAAHKEAAKTQGQLAARAAELPGILEKQQAKTVEARQRYEQLQDTLAGTVKPTQRLKDSVISAGNALADQEKKLGGLIAEYEEIGTKLRAAGSATAIFAAQTEKAADRLDKGQRALAKIKDNLSGLQRAQRIATADQANLTDEIERGEKALADQVQEVERAKAAYGQLTDAMQAVEAQQRQIEQTGTANLEQDLFRMGHAAALTEKELAELQARLKTVQDGIGALGVPTRDQSNALMMLTQAADETEMRLGLQQEALENMERVYRDNGTELDGLRKTQAAFIQEQAKLGNSMAIIANDGFKARQAIRLLHDEERMAATTAEKLRREQRETANATRDVGAANDRLSQSYRRMHGDKRTTLSLMQRLRGELLAMAAAYGGLYAAVEVLRQVTESTLELEAAQSRLNVAMEGDNARTADELDWIRRQANRLGIEFGMLANEYSKFAIATQNTNLEGERTRRIFQAVAEAARVSRTSNEELEAVFVALGQIASKNAVQLEELRQQLGDRLPGALQLMADALGISTAELTELTAEGQITADALLPFADEITRRFGGELPAALQSTAVSFGRLRNAATLAMVAFGEEGYNDALQDLAESLTRLLQSADFQAFAANISKALAVVLDALSILADNFQLVAVAGTALLTLMGMRMLPLLGRLAASFFGVTMASNSVRTGLQAATAAMAANSAAALTLTGRIRGLMIATRAFLASTGVGLAVVAIGAGIGYWATEADAATEAMSAHQQMIDRVRNAYEEVNGSVEEWREKLKDVGEQEAVNNLNRMRIAVEELEDSLAFAAQGNDSFWTNFFGYNLSSGTEIFDVPDSTRDAVAQIAQEFINGTTEADEFYLSLNEVLRSVDDGSEEFLQYSDNVLAIAKSLISAKVGAEQAELIITALTGTAEEAAAALEQIGDDGEDAAEQGLEPIKEDAEDAAKALEELEGKINDFNTAVRDLLSRSPQFEDAVNAAEAREEVQELIGEIIELGTELAAVKKVGDEIGNTFEAFKDLVNQTTFDGILGTFLTDLDGFITRLTAVATGITNVGNAAAGAASGLGGLIDGALGGIGNFMADAANTYMENLTGALRAAGFTDEYIRAAIAVVMTESGGNLLTSESHRYQPDRARQFHSEFRGMSDAQIQAIIDSGAEAFFEFVYGANAASPAHGNTQPGDGFRFRGRGPIQIAGRANYEHFAQVTGHDIVNNPDLLTTDLQVALDVLAAFLLENVEQTGNALEDVRRGVSGNQAGVDNNIARDRSNLNALPPLPNVEPDDNAISQGRATTEEDIERMREANDLERLRQQGLEREAFIAEKIAEARRNDPTIDNPSRKADLEEIIRLAGEEYDLAEERKRLDEETAAQNATDQTISDAEFELHLQQLKIDGLHRQAAIEQAIRDAKKADANITEAEIAQIARLAGARYDAERAANGESDALDRAKAAQEIVNQLLEKRNALEQQYKLLLESGDTTKAAEAKAEIEGMNVELQAAIANATAMWQAVGGPAADAAVVELENAEIEIENFGRAAEGAFFSWTKVGDVLFNTLTGAIETFNQSVAEGKGIVESLRDAFLKFASDFLIQIGRMILQQAIFNALKAAGVPMSVGGGAGAGVGLGHTGGMVGSSRIGSGNSTRTLDPAIFAYAPRFHSGGIAGLRPGEVPAVLKKGENVQTEDDPYHPMNVGRTLAGMMGSQTKRAMKIVNAFSGSEMLEHALSSPEGDEVILNYIRSNADRVRAVLG